MAKKYKKILFDLDNTLVDDDENRKYAIKEILIQRKEKVTDEKLERFIEIDNKFWQDRAEGKIKEPCEIKENDEKVNWLRAQRFIIYFNNITFEEAIEINKEYISLLGEKVVPIKNSTEILKYLFEKDYELYIITNGPTQAIKDKLNKINAQKYFKDTFSGDEAGRMKPHAQFFEVFFEKIGNYKREEMLIIGDELEKDVLGGIKNGIDTCWFNPGKLCNDQYQTNYEINELLEIKNIL